MPDDEEFKLFPASVLLINKLRPIFVSRYFNVF